MNPLIKMMGGAASGINPQAAQQIRQMASALRSVSNPQAALAQMAQQNPNVAAIMQMCRNKNPQAIFVEQCRQHGIDPNDAMQQIQSLIN